MANSFNSEAGTPIISKADGNNLARFEPVERRPDYFNFGNSNLVLLSDVDIVIIGIADESGSHAKRKGASAGPDNLRSAFNDSLFFERAGKKIPIQPMWGRIDNKKIIDVGNVDRTDLYSLILKLVLNNQIPIVIGGDHSITTIVLQAIGDATGKVGLLYFDAHPDFVSSSRNYYGSVLTDSQKNINFDKSLLIGTRSAEPEELDNARAVSLEVITPLDISDMGLVKITDKIISKAGSKKYISIDLDCLDPAYAPGVSVPSPAGLDGKDLLYIIKRVISSGIIGLDIVELCPAYDLNNMTANLASRILLESVASINLEGNRRV